MVLNVRTCGVWAGVYGGPSTHTHTHTHTGAAGEGSALTYTRAPHWQGRAPHSQLSVHTQTCDARADHSHNHTQQLCKQP